MTLSRNDLRPMARRFLALLMLMPAAVTSLAQAEGSADGASLIGTWRLVAFEDRSPSQPPRFLYGTQPKGLLVYDATGHMSVQIMKGPRPKVISGNDEKAAAEMKAALFDTYAAYFGTYSVDAARGIVTHHVEGDLADAYTGRNHPRPYELSGNRLILKPRWTEDGKQWEGIRAFERIERSAPSTTPEMPAVHAGDDRQRRN